MTTEKIRRISIGVEVITQFHYVVGGNWKIPIHGKSREVVERTLTDIVGTETHYHLHISNGAASQFWKKLPKNDFTTEEYFID